MPHRTVRRQTAFTLTELLITIGIIVLLIGILLPTVSAVRRAAWGADTKNTISQISSAITRYYQDHNAYPGAFRNTSFLGDAGQVGLDGVEIAFGTNFDPITMTESMTVALLGGLWTDLAASAHKFDAARTTSGRGPQSLNPQSPKQYTAYMPASDKTLSPGLMSDAGIPDMNDSVIPEFLDAWPQGEQLPIIYMRATSGANGIISDGNDTGTNFYQYDLRFITPYLRPTDGLSGLGVMADGITDKPLPNALAYFKHPSVPGPNNASGTPVEKDRFLLIAAGADRIFGTNDDIRSWGD